MEDNIQIIYNAKGDIILALGEDAIQLTRQEAEHLFVDLGNVLKDQDIMKGNQSPDKSNTPSSELKTT